MKRCISLFLCAVLLLLSLDVVAVHAANTLSIICEDVVCEAGEQIDVGVTISNNPGFAYLEVTPIYSPELTLVEVANGELISDFTKGIQYVWVADEDVTANGLLMTFTFNVEASAPEGTYSVGFVVRTCANYNEDLVQFSVESGTVNVGLRAPTEIDQFEYSLSGTEMMITGYTGEDTVIVIGSTYTVDGTEYTVTTIGEEAFAENTAIESVTLPTTVTEVGDYAFYLCENLKAVNFSEGLQAIGADAFDGCISLTEVTLPKTLRAVGDYAFYDCTALTKVTLLGKDTEIGDVALGYYYISRKEDGLVEGFVVEGHDRSTAQTYAETEGVSFKPLLRFAGASISLEHNLAINYKVDKALFEDVGYTAPYVVFELNGVQTKVSDYLIDGDRYVFTFRNIAPNQMNDTIYATLYATYDGVEHSGAASEYSVAKYCYNMLDQCTANKYAELRTLLVDLLNYGAISQLYTNYNTSMLVDKDLTDTQKAWGTSDEPILESVKNVAYETVNDPKASWKGGGLRLDNAITLRFVLTAESIDGLSVKVCADTKEWTIPYTEFVETEGGYYVYFNGLNAGQMSESVYLTVFEGDTPVSNTACYSIESYAYEKQDDSSVEYLADLVKAMMKYGNAAYAYVNG